MQEFVRLVFALIAPQKMNTPGHHRWIRKSLMFQPI